PRPSPPPDSARPPSSSSPLLGSPTRSAGWRHSRPRRSGFQNVPPPPPPIPPPDEPDENPPRLPPPPSAPRRVVRIASSVRRVKAPRSCTKLGREKSPRPWYQVGAATLSP